MVSGVMMVPSIKKSLAVDDTPIQGPLYHKFDTEIEAQVPSGRGDAEVADDAAKVAEDARDRLRPLAFGPSPLCTILIAELDGETVGYLNYFIDVFMDDATPTLHVADFFVRERYRLLGAGKALMLVDRI